MGNETGKTLIVMPALNEEANIADVIRETNRVLGNISILVVDDGSTDSTADIVRSTSANVISLPFNLGVGGAMRAGFRYAQQFGYSTVIQLDSDGQHDPRFVPEMLEALKEADIVIGARFAGRGDYEVSGPRKWAMGLLSVSLSAICGTRLTDTTSGFKAMGPKAVALFAQTYPAEYLGDTIEALVIANKRKLTISQIPVEMRVRAGGTPSQSPIKAAVYLARAFLALLVGLTRS